MDVKKFLSDDIVCTWTVNQGKGKAFDYNSWVDAEFKLFGPYRDLISFDLYTEIDKKTNVSDNLKEINKVIDELSKFALEYAKVLNTAKAKFLDQEDHLFKEEVKNESKSKSKRKATQAKS